MEELMDSENDICSATPFEVELHSRLLRAFEIAGDVNRAQYHRSKLKQLSTIFTETIFGCAYFIPHQVKHLFNALHR